MTVPEPKTQFYETHVPEAPQHRNRQDLIYEIMAINNLNHDDAERYVDDGPYSYQQLEAIIWRDSGIDI